jgi:hypothetical protein
MSYLSVDNKHGLTLFSFCSLGDRPMFAVQKPEFSLVTGDVLTYRCEGHDLIYDDLQMIYNDGAVTYERNRFDAEWRRRGTNKPEQVDIDWLAPTRFVDRIRRSSDFLRVTNRLDILVNRFEIQPSK